MVQPLAESGRPWLEWVGGSEVANGQARLVSAVPYGDWEGQAAFGFGVELPSVKQGREHDLSQGLPEGWRPFVVQTGMGTSIHGSDPTKAAIRAVDEAIRHNSLTGLYDLLRSTANKDKEWDAGLQWGRMREHTRNLSFLCLVISNFRSVCDRLSVCTGVFVTIACPMHELLDHGAVIAALPHGHVTCEAEEGGMLAETGTPGDRMLVALASVVVGYVDDSDD